MEEMYLGYICVDFGNGEEERKRPMGPSLGGPNILKSYWRVPFAIMVIDTVTKLEMIFSKKTSP
jgi:hypothetical protein